MATVMGTATVMDTVTVTVTARMAGYIWTCH
jgi:hypothetical protein